MASPIARESLPFAVPLAALSLLALALLPWWSALVPLALLAFTLWFFRDPERRTPDDAGALICPADGRVIRASDGKLSVFMNVFNVHVCRAPMAGTVESVRYTPGRFLAAFRDDAPEHNERTEIVLERDGVRLRFVLIAGLVARRIVCKVAEGQRVAAGERIGLIRFGSRVDVDLPDGAELTVRLRDRVQAGQTVIGRIASARRDRRPDPAPAGALHRSS